MTGMEHGGGIISLVLDTVFVLSLPGLMFALLAAVLYSGITLSLLPAKIPGICREGSLSSSHYTGVTGP